MLRKLLLLTTLFTLVYTVSFGQESWTLQKCLEYAKANSLTMKQAAYSVELANLTHKANRTARLPTLNGTASGGLQFGRTIDPTTNTFDNQTIGYNSISLNAGLTLYDGGRIYNSIQQSELDLEASKLEADASFNTLSLNIATAYLRILLAEEQLGNVQTQLQQSQAQLSQTEKLIQAGSLPANERLSILAQIALDEQNLILSENAVASNYLVLKQLLELDPNTDLKVVRPQLEIPVAADPDEYTLSEVYTTALGTQPQIEAGLLRQASAEKSISLARGNMLPRLIFFANLTSNWSSIGRVFNGTGSAFIPFNVMGPDGTITTFNIEQEFPIFEDAAYFKQINENFGQGIGLSLNIPIFNQMQNRIGIQRAQVGVLNQKLLNDQAKQNLKTEVQSAINEAKAASRSYQAAQRSLEAAQAAFENAEKRFQLGAINTFEYTTTKSNLDAATIELTRAKFQYLFNLKVVDFYLGRPLQLN